MNKKEEIKKQLTEWFYIMLAKYTWLKVKYEYNVAKGCYLVSFCIGSDIEDSNFDKDVLEFEEIMDNKYGDYSPLFCDNEELFKLSPDAEVLSCLTFTCEFTTQISHFDLENVFVSQDTNKEANSDGFCYNNHKHDMAA